MDVQEGFLKHSLLLPSRIAAYVRNHRFTHVIGTCFVNEPENPFVTELGYKGCLTEEERKIPMEIEALCEQIFCKPAYTCFTPSLIRWLAEKQIGHLYFCGLDTDACVLKSTLDAFEQGFKITVLRDLCESSGGASCHSMGIQLLERLIGRNNVR